MSVFDSLDWSDVRQHYGLAIAVRTNTGSDRKYWRPIVMPQGKSLTLPVDS
jgi:hypothetical protein